MSKALKSLKERMRRKKEAANRNPGNDDNLHGPPLQRRRTDNGLNAAQVARVKHERNASESSEDNVQTEMDDTAGGRSDDQSENGDGRDAITGDNTYEDEDLHDEQTQQQQVIGEDLQQQLQLEQQQQQYMQEDGDQYYEEN